MRGWRGKLTLPRQNCNGTYTDLSRRTGAGHVWIRAVDVDRRTLRPALRADHLLCCRASEERAVTAGIRRALWPGLCAVERRAIGLRGLTLRSTPRGRACIRDDGPVGANRRLRAERGRRLSLTALHRRTGIDRRRVALKHFRSGRSGTWPCRAEGPRAEGPNTARETLALRSFRLRDARDVDRDVALRRLSLLTKPPLLRVSAPRQVGTDRVLAPAAAGHGGGTVFRLAAAEQVRLAQSPGLRVAAPGNRRRGRRGTFCRTAAALCPLLQLR